MVQDKPVQGAHTHKKLLRFQHPLCPVTAVQRAFHILKLPPDAPAFVSDEFGTPMTGKMFNSRFKELIKKCGLDPSAYSSHSFRRGSATWALQCGIPGEVVMYMGDWKSAAYLAYLDKMPQLVFDKYMGQFVSKLPSHF